MELLAGISLAAIEQWGFTNNTGRPYITFPFKFSNVFTAISCICHNGSPSEANTVYNVSISGMNIGASGGGSGKYWCAFGVAQQQWGKILGDTVNLKIINFPVSFNECFGGLALFNGDPVAAAEYATITDITNTNFKIYMYANNAGTGYANANIFYLFLGAQQQWGKYTNSGNDRVITYPIAFSELYYANVISPDNCETFVYGISNTNINYRLCTGYNDDRWNGTQTSRLFAVGR